MRASERFNFIGWVMLAACLGVSIFAIVQPISVESYSYSTREVVNLSLMHLQSIAAAAAIALFVTAFIMFGFAAVLKLIEGGTANGKDDDLKDKSI